MIVVDVLLALNLLVFVLCALRTPGSAMTRSTTPRASRSRLDDLLAAAQVVNVPSPGPDRDATIIAFPAPGDLSLRRARAAHPSSPHWSSQLSEHHPSVGHS